MTTALDRIRAMVAANTPAPATTPQERDAATLTAELADARAAVHVLESRHANLYASYSAAIHGHSAVVVHCAARCGDHVAFGAVLEEAVLVAVLVAARWDVERRLCGRCKGAQP